MAYSRILVALAGQPDERHVVIEAFELARMYRSVVHLIHVNARHAGALTMMMDPEPAVSEDDLRSLVRGFGFESEADDTEVEVVTGSSIAKSIAAATREGDLLILGRRKKGRMLSTFADTADKHLCDIVDCPVLIVPRDKSV